LRHWAKALREPGANFLRIVIEGAHAACICDAPVLVDHIEALGPCGIGQIRRVTHVVDPEGQRIFLPLHKIVGDGHALLQSFRLRVAHILFHVRFHLPFICGMRLAHINGKKVRVILVVVVNLDHVADVAPEGRSSVAAEDDHERARAGALTQTKMVRAVQRQQLHVRSIGTDA
jgi:hypothetical protein